MLVYIFKILNYERKPFLSCGTVMWLVCFYYIILMSFQELRRWGMTNTAHRKLFMDGKSKIQLIKQEESVLEGNSQDALNESSPALFPSSPSSQPPPLPPSQAPPLLSSQLSQGSHLSQLSTTATQPFSQAIEVVHIQMRKNFNS